MPLRGGSFLHLPKDISNKFACINIQNNDEFCAAWAITAALYPARDNVSRVASYPHFSQVLKLEGVTFPLNLKDFSLIEELNNISINVFGIEYNTELKQNEVCGPLYHTKLKKSIHINLLYFTNIVGKDSVVVGHYCLIKNISKLVQSQISKHKGRIFICDSCLAYFHTQSQLTNHCIDDCIKVVTRIPTNRQKPSKNGTILPENILKFNEYEKKFKVPFVVYADFESILKPIQTCSPDPSCSYTYSIDTHLPFSFAYKIVCSYNESLSKYVQYTGVDCAKVFLEKLTNDVTEIYTKYLNVNIPMHPLTEEEEIAYNNHSDICHICEEKIDSFNISNPKVRDHDHLTGKYRGAAHSKCNLNLKIPNFIPIFFHNMSAYDAHLFVKELSNDSEPINIIPINKERYISFSKTIKVEKSTNNVAGGGAAAAAADSQYAYFKLRFLDSFRFMASSIEKLAKNLDDQQCKYVSKEFAQDYKKFKLIRRKGIFPYTYITDFSKLYETKLPGKAAFYNTITGSGVSDNDYAHAQVVWNTFECKNLKEYAELYLKSDVLLLADIFENFRETCLTTYGLDAAQFYTLPGLSWSAVFKYTKISLELLTDIEQYQFIKRGIRGGICQAVCRYSQANNKYMQDYNPDKPSSFLSYIDMNNLYGWSLSQCLPYKDFKWVEPNEIDLLDVSKIPVDGEYGYIFEVDILYDISLHDKHNELPFLVESQPPPNKKFEKLIPNLRDKYKYVVHYRNLAQALEHGLKITKIHRVLKFQQKPWLKPYIDLNTNLRANAKNDFEKDAYKLMNNAVYGKTVENVEKRVNVKLVNHWENRRKRLGIRDLIASLNFENISIFTENLAAVQLKKTSVIYNKPIYVGFTVLDLSKYLMYEFYYDFMYKNFTQNFKLCYMDTDSFVFNIKTDDWYEFIKHNLDRFDTSNFNKNNQFNMPLKNKAVLGLMKDECAGKILKEFIALRAKMYAMSFDDDCCVKKIKGIQKSVVQNSLTVDDYRKCLFDKIKQYREQTMFRSIKHNIYTLKQNKLALSYEDDKRFICDNNISTFAWGHYNVPN